MASNRNKRKSPKPMFRPPRLNLSPAHQGQEQGQSFAVESGEFTFEAVGTSPAITPRQEYPARAAELTPFVAPVAPCATLLTSPMSWSPGAQAAHVPIPPTPLTATQSDEPLPSEKSAHDAAARAAKEAREAKAANADYYEKTREAQAQAEEWKKKYDQIREEKRELVRTNVNYHKENEQIREKLSSFQSLSADNTTNAKSVASIEAKHEENNKKVLADIEALKKKVRDQETKVEKGQKANAELEEIINELHFKIDKAEDEIQQYRDNEQENIKAHDALGKAQQDLENHLQQHGKGLSFDEIIKLAIQQTPRLRRDDSQASFHSNGDAAAPGSRPGARRSKRQVSIRDELAGMSESESEVDDADPETEADDDVTMTLPDLECKNADTSSKGKRKADGIFTAAKNTCEQGTSTDDLPALPSEPESEPASVTKGQSSSAFKGGRGEAMMMESLLKKLRAESGVKTSKIAKLETDARLLRRGTDPRVKVLESEKAAMAHRIEALTNQVEKSTLALNQKKPAEVDDTRVKAYESEIAILKQQIETSQAERDTIAVNKPAKADPRIEAYEKEMATLRQILKTQAEKSKSAHNNATEARDARIRKLEKEIAALKQRIEADGEKKALVSHTEAGTQTAAAEMVVIRGKSWWWTAVLGLMMVAFVFWTYAAIMERKMWLDANDTTFVHLRRLTSGSSRETLLSRVTPSLAGVFGVGVGGAKEMLG